MIREIKRGIYPVVRMKVNRTNVPIVPIGDAHIGSNTFDEGALDRVIDWTKKNNAIWLGMGDLMEIATKSSPGAGVFEQVLQPQKQIDILIEKLKPIAHTCMGLIKGNHEERAFKTTGIDPMQIIANQLDIPYCGWEFYGIVSLDSKSHKIAYTIYAAHTNTSNKTSGLALNWMENNFSWINTDLRFRGHSHDMGFDCGKEVCSIDPHNMTITSHIQYDVMTGHYMGRPNSYIASRGAKPKPIGTVACWLSMKKGERKIYPEYLL